MLVPVHRMVLNFHLALRFNAPNVPEFQAEKLPGHFHIFHFIDFPGRSAKFFRCDHVKSIANANLRGWLFSFAGLYFDHAILVLS